MKTYRIIRNILFLFAMLCFFSCDKDEDLESERYDVIPNLKQTVQEGTLEYAYGKYEVYIVFLTDTRGNANTYDKDGNNRSGDFEYLIDEKLLTIKDLKSGPNIMENDWLLTKGGKNQMILVSNPNNPNPELKCSMTLTKQDYSN